MVTQEIYYFGLHTQAQLIRHEVFHYIKKVHKVCEGMNETVWVGRWDTEGGRSPAHTKTAHRDTSTGPLLIINTTWMPEMDNKNPHKRGDLLSPLCRYIDAFPPFFSTQPLQSVSPNISMTHQGKRGFTLHPFLLRISQQPTRTND